MIPREEEGGPAECERGKVEKRATVSFPGSVKMWECDMQRLGAGAWGRCEAQGLGQTQIARVFPESWALRLHPIKSGGGWHLSSSIG